MFTSPDSYVQAPDLSQNLNRYSYCLNNPLIYTDPRGEFIFTALALLIPGGQAFIPMAVAADIGLWGGGSAVNGTNNPFKWDYGNGKTWAGMGVGALAGGVGGGIGSGVIGSLSGMEAALVGGMAAGAVNGGGMTAINGGSGVDIMGAMVQGAVVGGMSAVAGYGAFQGADQLLKNFPMHNILSYLAASSTSLIISNTLSGKKPFVNIGEIFKDPGLLLPIYADIGPRIPALRNYIHKNSLKELNNDNDKHIHGTTMSSTELSMNGDLILNSDAYGIQTIHGQAKYPKITINPFTISHGIKHFSFNLPWLWEVKSLFIPNYKGLVRSLIISNL
jgi:hypothetical protein